jgi:hypothetical protein
LTWLINPVQKKKKKKKKKTPFEVRIHGCVTNPCFGLENLVFRAILLQVNALACPRGT